MNHGLRMALALMGVTGTTLGAAYTVLSQQGQRARRNIMIPGWTPLRADGVYPPEGGPVSGASRFDRDSGVVRLGMLGDSLAAGLGVDGPEQLPGVVLARGLAAELGLPVRLDTFAICGCTSHRLGQQVDAALTDPPHLAVIMIGANDVTRRVSLPGSARLLRDAVSRLRAAGAEVVVGTCPDLGAIRSIPQPLRALAHSSSVALARLQRDAVTRAGGEVVPLARLLARDFRTQPETFLSRDHYHPSAAGYGAFCAVLLPPLRSALHVGLP